VGTTLRGISPTFADRAARAGVRAGDLLDDESLKAAFETFSRWNKALLGGVYGEDGDAIVKDSFERLKELAPRVRPFVGDVSKAANDILEKGGKLLLEGAQGFYLDIDFGTYPYVTGTHTIASYAPAGLGIPSQSVEKVFGVIKAYCTRVGSGPFATEMAGPVSDAIRRKGAEYGATTGRPRRVGWLDSAAVRYGARASGATELILTKADVLGGLDKVLVCDGYTDGSGFMIEPPSTTAALRRCRPHYVEFEGWPDLPPDSWRKLGSEGAHALPEKLLSFARAVGDLVGRPVGYISYGSERSDMVRMT
jgi:adenylosuccinate synthase